MSYVLYYSPGAASMAVHWMLIEMGVPFEARLVDIDAGQQHDPRYLALNQSGRVPLIRTAHVRRTLTDRIYSPALRGHRPHGLRASPHRFAGFRTLPSKAIPPPLKIQTWQFNHRVSTFAESTANRVFA